MHAPQAACVALNSVAVGLGMDVDSIINSSFQAAAKSLGLKACDKKTTCSKVDKLLRRC